MNRSAYELEQDEPSTTDQVKEKAQGVVGQVQDSARSAKEKAGDRITQVIDDRSTRSGEEIIKMAESLRQTGASMRVQGPDSPAKVADQAADRVQALGLYLRDNDGNRILSDVEDFARRQPLIIAAGAFALGVAGARFLKASAARRQDYSSGTGMSAGIRDANEAGAESYVGVHEASEGTTTLGGQSPAIDVSTPDSTTVDDIPETGPSVPPAPPLPGTGTTSTP
jgi:hypothetical protein